MAETQMLWKGRPVEELTKEELVEALSWAVRMIEEERKLHRHSLDILVPKRPS